VSKRTELKMRQCWRIRSLYALNHRSSYTYEE